MSITSITFRVCVPRWRIALVRGWIYCVGYPLVFLRMISELDAEACGLKMAKWVAKGATIKEVRK